jgi:flagellar biosynthesis protein FliR
MEIFDFAPQQFMSFVLTLFRISLIMFLMPFFGGESIPRTVKVSICIVMTLALWPHLGFKDAILPAHPLGIAVMMLGELILGMILGMLVMFIFAAVQTGGQIIGFQMGFAMVNVVNPETGTSQAVTAHFLYMIAILTFLSLNGHLYVLRALTLSFDLVPPGGLFISEALMHNVMGFSKEIFVLAVRIAAPVMAALFLVDLALALVGRAAPQMNLLMLGFPLKISVGFFFLGSVFSMLALYLRDFIIRLDSMFAFILRTAT